MKAFIKERLTIIKSSLKQSQLLIIFITFTCAIVIISQINNSQLSPINTIRQLTTMDSQKDSQFKWTILTHLIGKTYQGTWKIQSPNETYENFTETKGTMQITFHFLKRTNIYGTFYYEYDMVIFDGEDNKHSLLISTSYFFTFNTDKPIIQYDSDTKVLSINDELQSFVSQYNYLALISQNKVETNTTMSYHSNDTGINENKELNGTIAIKDIEIGFNLKQTSPSFYEAVTSFCCWLSLHGMIQVFFFNYQLKLFTDYPDEALKYSPYTFVVNCLYNGSIGFECFLAAMINERLFYIFMIPSIIYFINFSYIELKLFLLTMNIHERYDSRHSPILLTIKSRLIHFCILFYFLLICLFLYSFDIFFWKSVSLIIVLMTFIPQMIYGIKKNQNASIIYLILVSLNKLYIPVYFRTEGNYLFFKKDSFFVALVISILVIEIAVILFQNLLWRNGYIRTYLERGKDQKKNKNNKLYKTIAELKMKNIDIDNMKCSICLGDVNSSNQLHTNPGNSSLITNEEEKKKDSVISIIDNNKENKENKYKEGVVPIKEKCCKRAFKCFKVKGRKEKEIIVMMTPCKHIFHIECLEEWLKIKYSCPQCRCVLPQIN